MREIYEDIGTEGNQEAPIQPVTLAGLINGVELNDQERRAVLAADALPISLEKKGTLVVADIFMRDGYKRAGEVLDFDQDEAVDARDSVIADPRWEALWGKFTLLVQLNFAEVAIYKKAGMTHSEIAEILRVDVKEVYRISREIVDFGVTNKKGNSQVDKFNDFCMQVAGIDNAAGKDQLSTNDLAEELSTSPLRVSRARRRNIHQGIATSARMERKELIRSAILLNPGYSVPQILDNLISEGETGLTKTMIEHRRLELIDEGIIQSKLRGRSPEGQSESRLQSDTEIAEAVLGGALAPYLTEKKPVVLSQLRREVLALRNVSITTVNKLYHERKASGQPVPPLK